MELARFFRKVIIWMFVLHGSRQREDDAIAWECMTPAGFWGCGATLRSSSGCEGSSVRSRVGR